MPDALLSRQVAPDWEAFIRNIRREGTPARVHGIELFLDTEVQDAICARCPVLNGLDPSAPDYAHRKQIALQRFLGYDYVRYGIDMVDFPMNRVVTEDTAENRRSQGRTYIDEHTGPITSWAEFEAYPWPDPAGIRTAGLEWLERNLPDDMCVVGSGGFGHIAEFINWLMGYETLCVALFEQRDLVRAISDRVNAFFEEAARRILQFDRVKALWGSDDLGHRSGPLISPKDLREFVLPGHKRLSEMAHAAGRPYLLHSCGNLTTIMADLIEDVRIDAKHSFEDTIEDVREDKRVYGDRIALLGGIDVDFLCTASEPAIRKRVRDTLEVCMPGGGYCLGTGNSVANYIPVENYLVMLDEGRRYA